MDVKRNKSPVTARKKRTPMIPCSKEAEIAEIKTELKDLNKIVKGNGQKGLQQTVSDLNVNVPLLTTSVGILSGQVQELLDRKVASDTEKSMKLTATQKFWTIIVGIASMAGVIIMLADMFMKNGGG